MLAAVIKGPTAEAALAEMEQAKNLCDLFELRLDFFESLDRIGEIAARSPLPLIFTFRKKEQGGARDIPEDERLRKIEELLSFRPAYCDIEADTDPKCIERIAKKFPQTKWIGSYHNFEATPDVLEDVLQQMKNPHFALYKIATMARSSNDLLFLMAFAREHSKKTPLTCIAMGEAGSPSRVLGPIVGNAIDYSGLNGEASTLFQIDLKTLHETYRYRTLNRDTEVFALLGNPVKQSPGDVFHNAVFAKEGRNAVYVKIRLDKEELPEFYSLCRRLPFRGFSVTIPLKEAIIPLLDRIDPAAIAIGAVNTLTVHNQLIIGTNTDAPGALNAIERHLKVKDKRVAILGAGGTARAIACEARNRSAYVAVYNRTYERAKELADDLNVEARRFEEFGSHPFDLLVNTIPPSGEDAPPVDPTLIPRSATVMDVVYRPKETPLLKAAKQRGCHCIYGEEMFQEQARLQQLDWKKKYTTIEL